MSVSLPSITGEMGLSPISPNIQAQVIAVEDVVTSYGFPGAHKRGTVGVAGGKRRAFLAPPIQPGEMIEVQEHMSVEVPPEMSNAVACILASAGVSAQFLTHTLMPVTSGAAILVSAVPSHVMALAIAMAQSKGAMVAGEALTDSEREFILLARASQFTPKAQVQEFDIAYMGREWPWSSAALAGLRPNACVIQVASQNAPRLLGGPFIMRPSLPDFVAGEYEFSSRAAMVFRLYEQGKLGVITK